MDTERVIDLTKLLPDERERMERRFWERVEKTDDCWNWTGMSSPNGTGRMYYNNEKYAAYRIAYAFQVDIVPKTLKVWQACGNTRCVRPDHIMAGSRFDYGSWRAKNEIAHSRSKLDWKAVEEIRRRYEQGEKQEDIAKAFDITAGNVSNIVNYQSWKKKVYQ